MEIAHTSTLEKWPTEFNYRNFFYIEGIATVLILYDFPVFVIEGYSLITYHIIITKGQL